MTFKTRSKNSTALVLDVLLGNLFSKFVDKNPIEKVTEYLKCRPILYLKYGVYLQMGL